MELNGQVSFSSLEKKVNKVIYGGTTLIDLSNDTLNSPEQLMSGITAHISSGETIIGTLTPPNNNWYVTSFAPSGDSETISIPNPFKSTNLSILVISSSSRENNYLAFLYHSLSSNSLNRCGKFNSGGATGGQNTSSTIQYYSNFSNAPFLEGTNEQTIVINTNSTWGLFKSGIKYLIIISQSEIL